MSDHVAVRVNRISSTIDCFVSVKQWRQHFVLDLNCFHPATSGLRVVGCKRCDWLTDVAHQIGGKDWLIPRNKAVGQLTGDIVGCNDGLHAVDLPCSREIDRQNSCVRMWRAQRYTEQASIS